MGGMYHWIITQIYKVYFHFVLYSDGEKTPFDRVSLSDDVKPLESDEDSMMGDYDDDADMTKFNKDGSFIGVYMDKKGQDQTPVHQTQSTV